MTPVLKHRINTWADDILGKNCSPAAISALWFQNKHIFNEFSATNAHPSVSA